MYYSKLVSVSRRKISGFFLEKLIKKQNIIHYMRFSEKNILDQKYGLLVENICRLLEEGRNQAFVTVNNILLKTYWNIGQKITEYEQQGKTRAEYGSELLKMLSRDLKARYGKGFSKSNVYLMRKFYNKYPKFQTVSGKLSWSQYAELIVLDDNLERSFYEKQCLNENWSVRELKRQISSALFHRVALSKDKKGILELAEKGQITTKAEDLVKDQYVLEFLNISNQHKYSEKEFEQDLINNLQTFLLELGKGFTFVARQFRITLGNNHFYTDLVFYHRILQCFVLFDLKIGKVSPAAIGQMNTYLNYFKAEENSPSDNAPIGVILAAHKDNIEVEYALGGITNNLFVSKYLLYLPDKKQLAQQLKKLLEPNTHIIMEKTL